MDSLAKRNYLSELRDIDWEFGGANTSDAITQLHWYPARFVAQVPGILVGYFSSPGDLVLDPFCGSGTTLVEAKRQERACIGIDTNPVATLVSRAKLIDMTPEEVKEYAAALMTSVTNRLLMVRGQLSVRDIPNLEENSRWYDPDTLRELWAIWTAIHEVAGPALDLGQMLFSAILRFACSQEKHWGWICDNVRPKYLVYKDAVHLFQLRLTSLMKIAEERSERPPSPCSLTAKVLTGTCAEELESLERESVDLVVTSPPYFGVTDYVRSQRLSLLWLGGDLDQLKMVETGARFKRSRRSSLEEYLEDMDRSFEQIARVLRDGRKCCIVIGESPNRAPYLESFASLLRNKGFEINAEISRHITSRRALSPQIVTENIVICTKGR